MDFQFKRGIILSKRLNTANYFVVRVIPDMIDIQETDLLPTYPCFFGEDNIAYTTGDEVWLVASPDFTTGYVLGKYQNPMGGSISPILELINEAEKKAEFILSNYEDLSVRSIGGRAILFDNIKNGQSGQIFNNRIVHLYSSLGESFLSYPNVTIKVDKRGNTFFEGKDLTQNLKNVKTTASSITEEVGSHDLLSRGNITQKASGSIKDVTASNRDTATTGDSSELVAKKKSEVYGMGLDTKVVAGGHDETLLIGSYNLSVVAGEINLTSSLGINLKSTKISISSPFFQGPLGGLVTPGLGPFCALPFCLATGAPHSGNIQVGGL